MNLQIDVKLAFSHKKEGKLIVPSLGRICLHIKKVNTCNNNNALNWWRLPGGLVIQDCH